MREAQKREKSKVSTSKKPEPISAHEQLDPELARLTPEQRAVGWKHRLVEFVLLGKRLIFCETRSNRSIEVYSKHLAQY